MKVKYYLNKDGEFVIENFNHAKPFADFFPGIAGKYGIPMWAFFVNRGQCICSFGTKDKDHAVLEFFPANKSWQLASLHGYRTFIKVFSGKKNVFYEPFHNGASNLGHAITNKMFISSSDLKLEEENSTLGLRVKIEYFTVPNDSFAAILRSVTVRNESRSGKMMQFIDGLPQITPFGMNNWLSKELSRTLEAWMVVENLENNAPFYKLTVDPADKPEVVHINEGNFYLGFTVDGSSSRLIKPIIDPQIVFGPVSDFTYPYDFLKKSSFKFTGKQMDRNKTPCGFIFSDNELKPGAERTFYSYAGYLRSKQTLNKLIPKITRHDYIMEKRLENKKVIGDLQKDIFTKSSSRNFDLYAKQTYLDNVLRGGYPFVFGSKGKQSVFYLYSRKHGDLERDYNRFHIQPSYFSQGNGNYRDVNQNRRCDCFFNPLVQDENIISFFNLLQLDGYNPLVVKGSSFSLKDKESFGVSLEKFVSNKKDIDRILGFVMPVYTPGDLILFLQENEISLNCSFDEFLLEIVSCSEKNQDAEHGEGFWTDHWAYNLDLLDNYFSIYPEKVKELVFDKKIFTYFDNTEIVRPRHEKYVLYNAEPRQLNSVHVDTHKKEMIRKRSFLPHIVRINKGEGDIYRTTLIEKLICLALNKISSLDPFGVGIEMEANKPNWYDALNGLPALFGSSVCETFELKRLLLFIQNALDKAGINSVFLPEEIHDFFAKQCNIIRKCLEDSSQEKDFVYWEQSSLLKEAFRKRTMFGLDGTQSEVSRQDLDDFLTLGLKKLDNGIEKAKDKENKIYYSYFINEVADFDKLNSPNIKPKRFIQKKVPFFLESQVHALRLSENKDFAAKLHEAVKRSELFDKELKMYKVTASLKNMPETIGRCRVFTPGWLENESIWLHMEYKYMLELIKQGLAQEFYHDFKNVFVPFLDPEKYGRSILENSSFIVSSAYPEKSLHGNGFVARLSGSTAEFLQIWSIMNMGSQPFFMNAKNELNLRFSPNLAGWLFRKTDKTYSFNFLGSIEVVYSNKKLKDTFGPSGVVPRKISFKDKAGNPVVINSDTIPFPYAEQVRSRLIKEINISLE